MFNGIGDAGGHSLCQMLEKNLTLTSLELRANSIGDAGCESLCQMLEKNTSLATLDLECIFSDAGKQAVKTAWGQRGGTLKL